MSREFEKIIGADTRREYEALLPFMQDPRISQAVLAEAIPELGLSINEDEIVKEVAMEHGAEESLVREALERAKSKFERIQEIGY